MKKSKDEICIKNIQDKEDIITVRLDKESSKLLENAACVVDHIIILYALFAFLVIGYSVLVYLLFK